MTPDSIRSPRQLADKGLALIGYRGTGKSTVGRIVAARAGRSFFDADLELEARAGRSVASILTEDGEAAFRNWEERTLADLVTLAPTAVIAAGGGVVLREQNRRRLRELGCVVWLTAAPSELASRLLADPRGIASRPGLTADGTLAEIAQVLEKRAPLYEATADTVIDTSGKTPGEVASLVFAYWIECRQ